jgi:hypothetical protein
MVAKITAANSSPTIEEALIAPTPCYPPWRFQSYSTAKAVWCVSKCGPPSADVKESAFIERPTREFVSIPGRRRRRHCCRRHSCRQSSANAIAADTQAIETGKGVEGNGALRPLLRRPQAQSPVHGREPVALRRVYRHARRGTGLTRSPIAGYSQAGVGVTRRRRFVRSPENIPNELVRSRAPRERQLPEQRTSSDRPVWSVSCCHEETHAPQQSAKGVYSFTPSISSFP